MCQVLLQRASTYMLYVVFHPPPPPPSTDAPTDRDVAGLRLPVFDREEEEPRPTGSAQVGGANPQ